MPDRATQTQVSAGWKRSVRPTDTNSARDIRTPPHKTDYIDEFYKHLRIWRAETAGFGLQAERLAHPSFNAIVAMGSKVVPLIYDEISIKPDFLVVALKRIVKREPPMPPNVAGRINEVVDAWLLQANRSPIDAD